MLNFRDGKIKSRAQAIRRFANNASLLLERVAGGYVDIQGAEDDRHGWLTRALISVATRERTTPWLQRKSLQVSPRRLAQIWDAFFSCKNVDDIADFDVIEVGNGDAALVT